MKKIFTLFCAMMLVLSVSATPEFTKGMKMQTPNRGNLPQLELSAAQMNAVKHGVRLTPKTANPVKKAPAAAQGTLAINDVECWYMGSYNDDTSWEFDFYNGNDYVASITAEGIDGTHIAYSYSNISGEIVLAAGDTVEITSGSFDVAYVSASGNYSFDANVVGSNGQNYNWSLTLAANAVSAYDMLNYFYYYYGLVDFSSVSIDLEDAPFVETGDTIQCDLGRLKIIDYTANYGDYYIHSATQTAPYYGQIDIVTTNLIGTFGADDFDMTYTKLYDMATGAQIALKSGVSATVTSGVDTTYVTATVLGKDGNVYVMFGKAYALTAIDTITINVSNAKLYDYTASDGIFQVGGYEGAYYVSAAFEVSSLDGTYTQDDQYYDEDGYSYTYLVQFVGGDTVYIDFDDQFTFTGATNGNTYNAIIQGIGSDAHYYIVSFVAPITTALDEVAAEQKAVKVIENGKLYIIKNGVKYNAAGLQVK